MPHYYETCEKIIISHISYSLFCFDSYSPKQRSFKFVLPFGLLFLKYIKNMTDFSIIVQRALCISFKNLVLLYQHKIYESNKVCTLSLSFGGAE